MLAGAGAAATRLRVLVGVVVTAGLACVAIAGTQLAAPPGVLVTAAALLAVASGCTVPIRFRTQQGFSLSTAAVLLAVAVLPAGWVVVGTTVGVAAGKAIIRRPLPKVAFNAAKDTLGAAAAVVVAGLVGLEPGSATRLLAAGEWSTVAAGLAAAGAAYAVVDELVAIPVVSAASGSPWRQVAIRGLVVRSVARLVLTAGAFMVVLSMLADGRLFAVAPLLVLTAHLAYTRRMRVREERELWRDLLAAADRLAGLATRGDLPELLRTAAASVTTLFPGVAVQLRVDDLVVGADPAAGRDPGPAGTEPDVEVPLATPDVEVPLATAADSGPPAGMLRVWLGNGPGWTGREQQLLRDFAASVTTSVRACQAHATAAGQASQDARYAWEDPLTGVANRRRFDQQLAQALSRRPRDGYVALLLLDLDHVKQVNDSLGHACGDRLLTEAASRLHAAAGRWLVARLGSDEFVVVMTGLATPMAAVARARGLLDRLVSEPVSIDEVTVEVAATAGLAVAGDAADPAELLRRADVAMYQAKGVQARLRLGVYEKTRDRRGLGVAGGAGRGLPADRMQVHYRPVVELATGRAVAAEALPRWRHPEFGDLAGSQALVVAQRSGLLAQLSDLVLDQALAAARLWRRGGFDLPVSIPVTPRMAGDPRYPAAVLDKLRQAEVPPQRLVVELGQLGTVGPVAPVRHSLAQLRDAGVRVGLGGLDLAQPPLSLVRALPADQLRVDFTRAGDITLDPTALAVVGSMAELGRRLGVAVIACDVARENQRQLLHHCGCRYGQGSMFAGVRSAEDLLRHLNRGYDGRPGALAPPLPDAEPPPRTSTRAHRLHRLSRGGLTH